jgi:hypothetical protein
MLNFRESMQILKAFNPDQPRDNRGRWSSGGGGGSAGGVGRDTGGARTKKPKVDFTASLEEAGAAHRRLGQNLKDAFGDRAKFDTMLRNYADKYRPGQIKAIAREMTGYDVMGSKAEVLRRMTNWQREWELNEDLHRAQAKLPV